MKVILKRVIAAGSFSIASESKKQLLLTPPEDDFRPLRSLDFNEPYTQYVKNVRIPR